MLKLPGLINSRAKIDTPERLSNVEKKPSAVAALCRARGCWHFPPHLWADLPHLNDRFRLPQRKYSGFPIPQLSVSVSRHSLMLLISSNSSIKRPSSASKSFRDAYFSVLLPIFSILPFLPLSDRALLGLKTQAFWLNAISNDDFYMLEIPRQRCHSRRSSREYRQQEYRTPPILTASKTPLPGHSFGSVPQPQPLEVFSLAMKPVSYSVYWLSLVPILIIEPFPAPRKNLSLPFVPREAYVEQW